MRPIWVEVSLCRVVIYFLVIYANAASKILIKFGFLVAHIFSEYVTRRNKRCQPSQNEFFHNVALKLQTRISREEVIRFS